VKRFWLATRPYSFTATLVPVLIGTAVAKLIFPELAIHWGFALLALLGSLGAQVVANVVNDIVDADTKLDNQENYGRFNALIAGLITRAEAIKLSIGVGVVSLLVGAYLIWQVGTPVLVLVLAGAFLAIFYTAPPFKLKYVALGDVAVLLGFGLMIVAGSYVVQSYDMGGYLGQAALIKLAAYSVPSAMLVVAILHANNHRDRRNDEEFGAKTLANRLSPAGSKAVLLFLMVGAYVFAIAAAVTGLTTPWVLLVLLSAPPLLRILGEIKEDRYEGMLVPQIAQLHGMFGILTTAAIVIKIFV
jgi:1,4-dihydroxy-2-naphthoate octaprenyltransferase